MPKYISGMVDQFIFYTGSDLHQKVDNIMILPNPSLNSDDNKTSRRNANIIITNLGSCMGSIRSGFVRIEVKILFMGSIL